VSLTHSPGAGELPLRLEVNDMNAALKSFLTEVKNQVLGDSPQKKLLKYTIKCKQKMEEHRLTEANVEDVFRKGEKSKGQKLVRRFNGYEIGMYYFKDSRTGDYIVTAVWRRERR
jgi:hypothetical protein